MSFYDDMFERLEDAADRAVLARLRTTCPKMPEQELEAWWLYLVTKSPSRADARAKLEDYLNLHDNGLAAGHGGLFDAYGNVLD